MTPSLKIIAKQINPIATVRAMLDVFFLLLWFVSLDPASREGNGGTKNAKEIWIVVALARHGAKRLDASKAWR